MDNVSGGDVFSVFFRLDDFFAVFIYAMKENQVARLEPNRDKPCFPLDAESFIFRFHADSASVAAIAASIAERISDDAFALYARLHESCRSFSSAVFCLVVIGAFGAVTVSGDGVRVADHSLGVKFILPNNENIFESIN